MITQVNHLSTLLAGITNQLWFFLLSPDVASATLNRLELLGKRKPFAVPARLTFFFFLRDIQSEGQRGLVSSGLDISPDSKLSMYFLQMPSAVIQHRSHSDCQTPTKGTHLLFSNSLSYLPQHPPPPPRKLHKTLLITAGHQFPINRGKWSVSKLDSNPVTLGPGRLRNLPVLSVPASPCKPHEGSCFSASPWLPEHLEQC